MDSNYQKKSHTYKSFHRYFLESLLLRILKEKKPQGRLLELGSKNGSYEKYYKSFKSIIFSDINPENNKVIKIDSRNIPFEKDKFGCVIALEMLEYQIDYEQSLKEIYRVAKKDSSVIISIPVFCDAHFDSIRILPNALNEILIKIGFKIVDSYTFGNYVTIGIDYYKRNSKTPAKLLFRLIQKLTILIFKQFSYIIKESNYPSGIILHLKK